MINRKETKTMVLTIDSMKEKSKGIIIKAMNDYHAALSRDKNEKQSSLRPGETLGYPSFNGFYSSENRDKAAEILDNYRFEIANMLDEVTTEVKSKSAEPPTTEQANLLSVLSIGKPTETELKNALETHSGNYATYSAIQRIAADNGYHFTDEKNPLNNLVGLQTSLTRDMDRLRINNAEAELNPARIQFEETFSGIFGNN